MLSLHARLWSCTTARFCCLGLPISNCSPEFSCTRRPSTTCTTCTTSTNGRSLTFPTVANRRLLKLSRGIMTIMFAFTFRHVMTIVWLPSFTRGASLLSFACQYLTCLFTPLTLTRHCQPCCVIYLFLYLTVWWLWLISYRWAKYM